LQQRLGLLTLALFTLLATGCATRTVAYVPPPPPTPLVYTPPPAPVPVPHNKTMVANASWYGPGFDGHRTANGERFSSSKMTAAAKGLPLGSRLVVTNLSNGRSATVRINDCGPFRRGRKIDLSRRAASKLGIIHKGTARVKVRVITKPPGATVCES